MEASTFGSFLDIFSLYTRKYVGHFCRDIDTFSDFFTAGLSELMIPVVCTCQGGEFQGETLWNDTKNSWLLLRIGSLTLDHWNRASNLPQVSRGTPSHFGLHFKHHLLRLQCDDDLMTRNYCYGHGSNRSDPGPSMYTSYIYISIPYLESIHIHTYPSQHPNFTHTTASSRRAVWTCRVKARL